LYDLPTADEVLAGVARYLREEAGPALTGRLAFHARVAANAVDLVRRELALGPEAVAEATSRMKSLLGHDGTTADLEQALCETIASGKIDLNDPALVEHLWKTTLDTLAVEQPSYATYRRAAAETSGG
jgi:hypothetical protein